MSEERKVLTDPGFSGENPAPTTAHFTSPSAAISDKKNPPLKVTFRGWRRPLDGWKDWVNDLRPKYQSVWQRAGIYEAIMASIYSFQVDKGLLLCLAEKWNAETNTFVFPWGSDEATVSLEDIRVLGGFSVLGESVLATRVEPRSARAERELAKACRRASPAANKATARSWLRRFRGSGDGHEHEAFLALWLFHRVFPTAEYYLDPRLFPLAARLARGERIALAPAVLASLYRDMRALSKALAASARGVNKDLTLTAPFCFVQLWAWERFPALCPNPILLSESTNSYPRIARWPESGEKPPIDSGRLAIDSSGESFRWHPYGSAAENLRHERWAVRDISRAEIEGLARCLRPSELVGLDGGIEQYLPHRVAKQFGMDLGLPRRPVARRNSSTDVAWSFYCRPIGTGSAPPPASPHRNVPIPPAECPVTDPAATMPRRRSALRGGEEPNGAEKVAIPAAKPPEVVPVKIEAGAEGERRLLPELEARPVSRLEGVIGDQKTARNPHFSGDRIVKKSRFESP